jgi:hypothetical protein
MFWCLLGVFDEGPVKDVSPVGATPPPPPPPAPSEPPRYVLGHRKAFRNVHYLLKEETHKA